MKKILFTLLVLVTSVFSSNAQSTSYRMNVQTLDGNVFSVNADSVTRVYFSKDGKSSGLSDYSISGYVEKGPFLSGSSITIQPIDERLFSLGGSYSTSTSNACGEYNINIAKMPASTVLLTANGSYYDEDYQGVSNDRITLNAIVDLSNGGKHNINLLTNFKYYRIAKLVQEGQTLSAANKQAQKELMDAFGLSKYNIQDVSSFSLQNNDDGAGILTALSILLLHNRHHEGEFSNYLSKLVNDFADDGQFDDVNKQQFANDRENLSLENDIEYLVEYYKEQGKTINIPSLFKYYDWDNNGIAGDEIYDGTQTFTMDASEINSPYSGGTYTINIQSSIPIYTYKHGTSSSNIYVEGDNLYNSSPNFHYTLEDNVLTVTVDSTSSSKPGTASIELYDIAGTVLGTVTIHQSANPNGSMLSAYGYSIVNSVRSSVSLAAEKSNYVDAAYTNQIQNSDFKAPISTSNHDIYSFWSNSYAAINILNRIGQWCDEHNDETLKPMKYIYSGLLYANLITFFGDVPYITNTDYTYSVPRTMASTIFSDMITNIQNSFSRLSTDSVSHNSIDGFAFPTFYAAYAVAADIDLALGDYQKARDLLLNIVNSGKYGYNSFDANSNELIIAYPKTVSTRASDSSVVPAETYTDVMVKLAECEYHLGNIQKANEYVNNVATAKSVELSNESTIDNIKFLRNKILSGMGGYFAFLKRNGIAKSELGLKDYQLLLPIPINEINANPSMVQNPGY